MKVKFIVFLILMALLVIIDAASTARGKGLKQKPPPLSVTTSDPTPDVGETVVLTVNNTNDANPKWVLGRRQFRYGRSITLSCPSAGHYTVIVIAKDLRGKTKRKSITVNVSLQPPTINSLNIPEQSPSLDSIVFNAQATDPSGQTVQYFWDLGDGQSSTSQSPTYSYTRPGTYAVIELTIGIVFLKDTRYDCAWVVRSFLLRKYCPLDEFASN